MSRWPESCQMDRQRGVTLLINVLPQSSIMKRQAPLFPIFYSIITPIHSPSTTRFIASQSKRLDVFFDANVAPLITKWALRVDTRVTICARKNCQCATRHVLLTPTQTSWIFMKNRRCHFGRSKWWPSVRRSAFRLSRPDGHKRSSNTSIWVLPGQRNVPLQST